MKQKHNVNFATKWELINLDGKIVDKGGDETTPNCEGTISWKVYNKRKELVDEGEQPMGSFVCGFIEDCIVGGYRIAKRAETYQILPNSVGHCRTDSKVHVQNIGLIYPFNNFSNAGWTSSAINSTSSGFVLDSLTDETDSIRAVISCERNITSGGGNITECALYSEHYPTIAVPPASDDYKQGMIARDVFSSGISFGSGGFIKIKYTLDFPTSSNKTITKNWVKNLLQNIVLTNYTDFIQIDGATTATGVGSGSIIKGATFTKEENCRGGNDDDSMGIIIGSSNIPCTSDDSHLGSQIMDGTGSGEVLYLNMSQSATIATIFPEEGKANLFYSREFTNNSGSSITVKEAGLVAKINASDPTTQGISANGSYLLARWLTGDIVVPNNYTLKIYFMPEVRATPEDLDVDTDSIIVVTHEMRQIHPSLKKISMISKIVESSNWLDAINYAGETCTLGGYSDWRLPVQTNGNSNDVPENELKGIWTNYYSMITNWNMSVWSCNQSDYQNIRTVLANGQLTTDRKQYAYGRLIVR